MAIVRRNKRVRIAKGVYQNLRADGSIRSMTYKQGNRTETVSGDGRIQTINLGNGLSDVYRSGSYARRGAKREENELAGAVMIWIATLTFRLLAWAGRALWSLVQETYHRIQEERLEHRQRVFEQAAANNSAVIESDGAVHRSGLATTGAPTESDFERALPQTPGKTKLTNTEFTRDAIADAICSSGADAIREIRMMAGVDHDNEIREETLSASIAHKLHERLKTNVRTEVYYSTIASMLGVRLTEEQKVAMQGLRADVVIFDGNFPDAKPSAIVEIKKFAEHQKPAHIIADLHKARKAFGTDETLICVGVMVCETRNQGLRQREDLLSGSDWSSHFSEPELSVNREWRWSFGCLKAI